MSQRLYHYTAFHHALQIRASGGIAPSGVPVPDADGEAVHAIATGWCWLTTSDVWRQGWATQTLIRCDRTECRLTVEIPLLERVRLNRWTAVYPDFGYTEATAEKLARLGRGSNPATWFVFEGRIPWAWVRDIERRPDLDLSAPLRRCSAR